MSVHPFSRFLCCLIALSFPAAAEVYQWVDDQGRTHFSDTRPEGRATSAVDIKVTSYEFPRIDVNRLYPPATASPAQANAVILYSAAWCGICTKARKYFQRHRIPFQEYDVERSSRGRLDYTSLKGRGVPIILVGPKRLNGFSEAGFQRIYSTP